jgi:hypothetical protein
MGGEQVIVDDFWTDENPRRRVRHLDAWRGRTELEVDQLRLFEGIRVMFR